MSETTQASRVAAAKRRNQDFRIVLDLLDDKLTPHEARILMAAIGMHPSDEHSDNIEDLTLVLMKDYPIKG